VVIIGNEIPSNLRPTNRECVHLVMRGHFRSCDKDGGRTIRSAIAENPMLHGNVMALPFIEVELWPIKVLNCRNKHFRPFLQNCDLDHDPMTFIYELDPHFLEIHRTYKYELPMPSFRTLSSDRHTDTHTQTDRQI